MNKKRISEKFVNALSPFSILLYAGLLVISILSFWLAYLSATFTKTQQFSDVSSDLIAVFGVLLALSPLIRGREKRFFTGTLNMGGLLFSLETKLVAETSQDIGRLNNLFLADVAFLMIVAASYPPELLRMKDEKVSTDTEKSHVSGT